MKVLICGSRAYNDLGAVMRFVRSLPADTIVIHGGAVGVDLVAGNTALAYGLKVQVFRPDWEGLGRKAGMLRNSEMVAECDIGYAFWDGKSRGTADTIRKLKAAGKYREVPKS